MVHDESHALSPHLPSLSVCQNPAIFPSADTAFILSFSIIMLNTGTA